MFRKPPYVFSNINLSNTLTQLVSNPLKAEQLPYRPHNIFKQASEYFVVPLTI